MSYAPSSRAHPPGPASLVSLRARLLVLDLTLCTAPGDEAPLLERAATLARCADPDPGHPGRVASLAERIACDLGWPDEGARQIARAAHLHDVGKCALPRSLLTHPGMLTPAQRKQLVLHTLAASWLLGAARHPVLRLAAIVARSHHERWDGRGYPDGHGARQIPPEARIVAAADVWDALTHRRPYRAALSTREAAAIIEEMRGQALDPDVADALLRRVA